MKIKITEHPDFIALKDLYARWRLIKTGGDDFITEYLVKRPSEEDDDFTARRLLSWNPAPAHDAVQDTVCALTQRLIAEIQRKGGTSEYQKVIHGLAGGVDLASATMDSFVTRSILPELLFMGRVGVLIDASSEDRGETKANKSENNHPFLSTYSTEDVVNWNYKNDILSAVLLKETYQKVDNNGLVESEEDRYRFYTFDDNGVIIVTFHDAEGNQINPDTNEIDETINFPLPKLKKIPFVVFNLSQSLLKNIDKADISILNMESSDVTWLHRGNMGIFTEQNSNLERLGRVYNADAEEETDPTLSTPDKKVLSDTTGFTYPPGMDRPGFISPSPEPLQASMQKADQIYRRIQEKLNTDLNDLDSASAENKAKSGQSRDAGLCAIGQELQQGEAQIAEAYAAFEGTEEIATVLYPVVYELLTIDQRVDRVKRISEVKDDFPSKTMQQAIIVEQVEMLLGSRLPHETKEIIKKEIENAPGTTSDPEILVSMVEAGIMSHKTAAMLMYLPVEDSILATMEHTERLQSIAISQTKGVGALADTNTPEDRKLEKQVSQDPDTNPDGTKKVRGDAK